MDVWGDSRGKTPEGSICSPSCILFGGNRREVTGLEFSEVNIHSCLTARINESLHATREKIGKAITARDDQVLFTGIPFRPSDATRMNVTMMRQEARIVPRTEPATLDVPPARQR
jgi:hypothetical protein